MKICSVVERKLFLVLWVHLKNGHMWSPVHWGCTMAGVTSPLSPGNANPEIRNDSVFSALILLKWWWKCLSWIRENKTKKKENKSIKPVQLDQNSSGADVLAPYTLRHRGCDSFPLFANNQKWQAYCLRWEADWDFHASEEAFC